MYPRRKLVHKMLKRTLQVVLLTILFPQYLLAGGPNHRQTREEYIQKWKDVAIQEMRRYGIPASITLAQGILESGDGNGDLAVHANNHFGIKCHDWTGRSIRRDDDKKNECFRKYDSAEESFEDHSQFLANRPRYAFLFDYKITDYKDWAHGLKKAGYATNPHYPQLLIKIIEDNNLQQYDQIGLKEGMLAQTHTKAPRSSHNSNGSDVVDITIGPRYFVSDNDIKFIVVQKGDTYNKLSQRYNVGKRQLINYNDLERDYKLEEGDKLYIQPKRNKQRVHPYHTVQDGETLWDISQRFGVKMKKILKHNDLNSASEIHPGMKLKLR